ncbi:hypothetical protein LshimejAT787_0105460 [Lyophyllum shimeji]|uniref:Uncharacterized protein n=1 Tax=Lyophyllum shimeji TaxID=47721 RepID=A0A9P3PDV3_LYOSH|nr:hypothetical protein LshimejAT787_0105460 [Lyophyllum shimeji]
MHRIRPARLHADRRGLIPNVLSDVGLGKDAPTSNPLGLPLPDITSLIPLPPLSAPGSSSAPTSSSSSSIVSSTRTSSSSLSSSVTSSSSTPSPTPTPPPTSVYETTSGGQVHTLTTYLDATPSASQSSVPPPKSFLQNKVLSGVVFALIGLIALFVILAMATFALRRKRNNRLLKEAISFDPSSTMDSTHHYGDEKDRMSMGFGSPRSSDDRSGHGHAGYNAFGTKYTGIQGRTEHNITLPQAPARALSPNPQGYALGPGEKGPAPPAQPAGINWGRTPTPAPAPLPPTFGASNRTENTADERAQSQNRILKVANE